MPTEILEFTKFALSQLNINLDSEDSISGIQLRDLLDILERLAGGDDVQSQFNYLVERWREEGRVGLREIYRTSVIQTPPAPINPDNEIVYRSIIKFDNVFYQKIHDIDPKFHTSVIIYSLIRNSVLLDPRQIKHIYKNGFIEGLLRHNDVYWYRLSNDTIWIPDDLTLSFIFYFRESLVVEKSKSWFSCLKEFLKTYDNNFSTVDQKQFLSAMVGFHKTKMPAAMVNVQIDRSKNRFFTEKILLRSLSGKIDNQKFINESDFKSNISRKQARSKISAEISNIVKNLNDHEDLFIEISSLNHSLSYAELSVIRCVYYYAKNSTQFGTKKRKSGILRVYNDLITRFQIQFSSDNPEEFSDEELISELLDMINESPVESQPNLRESIEKYLWFLHRCQNRKLLKLDFKLNSSSSVKRPTILLPHEYRKLYDELSKNMVSEISLERRNFVKNMLLLLIIGYRLGLRRGEIENLLVSDFHLTRFMVVIVQPHQNHQLKTAYSPRQVAISGRFSDDELNFMKNYIRTRLNNTDISNKKLLASDDDRAESTYCDNLFVVLSRMLQAVTNDSKMRFHSLRHSFASRNFYMIMCMNNLDRNINNDYFRIDSEEFDRFDQYLRRVRPDDAGTRQFNVLHQLAAEMGHSSPETTLKTYVHTLDIISNEFRDRNLPRFTAKTFSLLLDRNIEAIYKHCRNRGISFDDGLFAFSSVRGVIHNRMKKIVKHISVDHWLDVSEYSPEKIYSKDDNYFNDLVKFLQSLKNNEITIKQFYYLYPNFRIIPKSLKKDSNLLNIVINQWSRDDKSVMQLMIENFLNLPNKRREEFSYRWSLISHQAPNDVFVKKPDFYSNRQSRAWNFIKKLQISTDVE
ncbi:MAG: site-specific integrase [Oleibacter sp.]|nr:site-specific integrase [Thalassolituus sp.]